MFYELANTLPLPRRVTNHLDKSGIMRVLLSFLRLRGLFADQEEDDGDDPMDCFYPQTLAGFVMTLTEDGDVIYLTESVSRHIGIPQVEIRRRIRKMFVATCRQNDAGSLRSCAMLHCLSSPVIDSWIFWVRVFSTLSIPVIRRSSETC